MNSVKCKTYLFPELEIFISPVKWCSELRINQPLTINQGVHITYFSSFFLHFSASDPAGNNHFVTKAIRDKQVGLNLKLSQTVTFPYFYPHHISYTFLPQIFGLNFKRYKKWNCTYLSYKLLTKSDPVFR